MANQHTIAHLLRRTARKLIAWSNRLDTPVEALPPASDSGFEPFRPGMDLPLVGYLSPADLPALNRLSPAEFDERLRAEAAATARAIVGPPPKLFGRR